MTLTKQDLVVRISAETGLELSQVFEIVQKTFDHITESLVSGGRVELRNFGVFVPRIYRARMGRNPARPEIPLSIPARALVKFKAGKEMKEAVAQLMY